MRGQPYIISCRSCVMRARAGGGACTELLDETAVTSLHPPLPNCSSSLPLPSLSPRHGMMCRLEKLWLDGLQLQSQ